jgi:hypothetical protein
MIQSAFHSVNALIRGRVEMSELDPMERILHYAPNVRTNQELNLVSQSMPGKEAEPDKQQLLNKSIESNQREHDADIVSATHFSQISNVINSGFGGSVGGTRSVGFSKGLPDIGGDAKAAGRGLKYGLGDQMLNAGLDGLFGSASNKAFLTNDTESFIVGAEAALPIHPGARRAIVAATWLGFRAYNYFDKR